MPANESLAGLTPIPGQLRDFVPNRPPDLHYPSVNGKRSDIEWGRLFDSEQNGKEVTCAGVWLPTESEPGYAYARIGETSGGMLVSWMTSHITNVQNAEALGLKTAVAMTGIAASFENASSSRPARAEIVFPGPEEFCRGADAAADAGLTYARFAVAPQSGEYSSAQLTRSLGTEGRMLIAPFASKPDAVDFNNVLHDMTLHGLGHMGLAKEVNGRKLQRARFAYWLGKAGIKFPERNLCQDIEIEIGIDTLQSCANGRESEFESFRPRFSRVSAAELTKRHIIARRKAQRDAEVSSAAQPRH